MQADRNLNSLIFHHVVAVDRFGTIGRVGENAMPWHHKADMRSFVQRTAYTTVLMGYNTYASLPKRPLPNRRMFVLTSDPSKVTDADGKQIIAISKLGDLLQHLPVGTTVNVIGGAAVYRATLPYTTYYHVNHLDLTVEDGVPLKYLDGFSLERDKIFFDFEGEKRALGCIHSTHHPAENGDCSWVQSTYVDEY